MAGSDVEAANAHHQHEEDVRSRLQEGCSSHGGAKKEDRSACNKALFWSLAVPVVLAVGVILPLALTVVRQQQELDSMVKPTIKSTSAALAASRDPIQPECSELIPKGPSPLGNPPPALKIQGNRIITGRNKEATLKGITWFGFNNAKTMADGLDAGNSTWIAADFATVVYRLKLLGFNAVRLPFSFADLQLPTKNYARSCSPSAPDSQAVAAATIRLEATNTRGPVPELPEELVLPVASASGTCNAYLPNGPSTLPRFLWVIQHLVASGMYVAVDYHPHLSELSILSDPDIFARQWYGLWSAFTCLPNYQSDLKGRVLLDLLNQPDEYNLGWAGGRQGRKFQPQGNYLLAAMDMIEGASPGEPIFLIQGGGQAALGTAWGDGFVTDEQLIRSLRLDDPRPFFRELLHKSYRKRTVLSPHFYGMTVTNNTYTGRQLWEKFTQSWGKLQATGFCHEGDCQRFPVVIGEVGSFLRSPMDLQQLQDMAAYSKRQAPTDEPQYPHAPISGWFWHCYNNNSKDTGGLVAADWQTLVWHKLTWLFTNMDLTPWWLETPPSRSSEDAILESVAYDKPAAR